MIPYKVTLTIGDWTHVHDSRVPVDPLDNVQLIDPLHLAWDIPEGAWPIQPDPSTLTINILSSQAGLPSLETGTPVTCTVTLDDGTPFDYLEFDGSIGSVDVQPNIATENRRKLHTTIVATDDDTALSETYVSGDNLPDAQDLEERTIALAELVAPQGINLIDPSFAAANLRGFERELNAVPLLTLLNEILSMAYYQRGTNVTTYGVDVAGVTYPAGSIYHSIRMAATYHYHGPFLLKLVNSIVQLALSPDRVPQDPNADLNTSPESFIDGCSVIDARHIETDSLRFRRDREKAVTVVELAAPEGIPAGGDAGGAAPGSATTATGVHPIRLARFGPITRRLTSHINGYATGSIGAGAEICSLVLGDEATSDDYQLDQLVVRVDKIPTAQVRQVLYGGYGEVSWFPRRFIQPQSTQASWKRAWVFGRQVVIINPDPEWNITGRRYIAGQLYGASATIAGGRLTLTGRLRPGIRSGSYSTFQPDPDRLSWANLAADPTLGTTDWKPPGQAIDPDATWVDSRLARLP